MIFLWFSLCPVLSVQFLKGSTARTMHIPKKLWEPTSGGTMLWIDEEGKLPLPEWMRGMRKLSANSKNAPSWMQSFSDGRSMADYVRYMKQDVRGLHAAEESPQILQALLELGWKPDALVALNTGENNLLMNGQSESIQMSAKMVNTVYPYNKKQASQPTISVDFWRHGGENKLWSVYDYTESYLQSCFAVDITSLTQSNDGHSDPSTRSTSTISLCTNNYAEAVLPNSTQRGRADVMKDFGEGQNRLNSRNERYFFDFGLHFGIQFSFAHCFHSPSKDELFFALLEVGTDFCGEVFLDPCYHRSSLHSSREESLKN